MLDWPIRRFAKRLATAVAWLALIGGPLIGMAAGPLAATTDDYMRGFQLFHAERYEEALPLFVRARDEARSRHGEDSAEHAIELNNLAELYRRMGRLDEAEPLFIQALAIDEARLGVDDPGLATTLNNLALLYRAQERNDEAERHLKRSLNLLEDALGHRHPHVASSLNNLAMLYQATGHPERARPLLERAALVSRDMLGETHPTSQRISRNLESVLQTLAEAEAATAPVEPAAAPPVMPLPRARPETQLAALTSPVRPETIQIAQATVEMTANNAADPPPAAETAETADVSEAVQNNVAAAALAVPPPAPRPQAGNGAVAAEDRVPDVTPDIAPDMAAIELASLDSLGQPPVARPVAKRWQRPLPGDFAVHLASVRSPQAADGEWLRLAGLHDVVSGIRQLEPERIEVPEQGVFYRVVGGPFASRDAAASACGSLRAQGQYCAILAHDH